MSKPTTTGITNRTITAATDTPTRADTLGRSRRLIVNRGTGVTISIDDVASPAFVAGDQIEIVNIGAGVVTIADAGVTLTKRSLDTLTLAQGGRALVTFTAALAANVSGSLVLA